MIQCSIRASCMCSFCNVRVWSLVHDLELSCIKRAFFAISQSVLFGTLSWWLRSRLSISENSFSSFDAIHHHSILNDSPRFVRFISTIYLIFVFSAFLIVSFWNIFGTLLSAPFMHQHSFTHSVLASLVALDATQQSDYYQHYPLDWPNRKRNHTLLILCHSWDLNAIPTHVLFGPPRNSQHRSHHRRRRLVTVIEL